MIRRNFKHWLNWHDVANGRAGEDRGTRLQVGVSTLPPQAARDNRGVLVVMASSLLALAWLGLLRDVRVGLPSLATASPRGTTEASRALPGVERQGVDGPTSEVIRRQAREIEILRSRLAEVKAASSEPTDAHAAESSGEEAHRPSGGSRGISGRDGM